MDPEELLEELDNKVEDLWLTPRKQPPIELLLILVLQIIAKSSNDLNAVKQDIFDNLIREVNNYRRYHRSTQHQIA